MSEPGRRFQLPWGTLLTASLLVGFLVVWHRLSPFTSGPASWRTVWFFVGTGLAAFLTMRWLYNLPWGFLTGLALPLHPVFQAAGESGDFEALAVLMALLILAGTVAAWRLLFLPRFAWRSWGIGVVMFAGGVSLAWSFHPRTGLVVSLFSGGGLAAATALAIWRRLQKPRTPPGWGNIVATLLVAIASGGGGIFLASAGIHYLGWPRGSEVPANAQVGDLVHIATEINLGENSPHGFRGEWVERWGWPSVWVMVPLMVWGFWRSLYRGWRLWIRRQPPLAWMLTIFAVVTLAGGALPGNGLPQAMLLSLASVSVLLALFGISDMFRGLMERLVLAPPEDREE